MDASRGVNLKICGLRTYIRRLYRAVECPAPWWGPSPAGL